MPVNRRDFLYLTAAMIALPASAAHADAAAVATVRAARRFANLRFGKIAYVERGKGPAAAIKLSK